MDGKWRDSVGPGKAVGDFRILRRIGSGGMGEVFLAEGPDHRPVAVKVIDPSLTAAGSESLERFRREVAFAQTVRHPNLVEVYGADRDAATGLHYVAMEYLPGGTLRAKIASRPKGLPFGEIRRIATDVIRALVVVESNGLVHRDVKPDNVLFDAKGVAKLADLGVSRFSRTDFGDVRATSVSSVVGTPAYMAPEQMLDSHAVDIRADIYSFGVMLHEMTTGRRPNAGEGAMNTLAKAIGGRAFPDVRAARPDAPPELAALVAETTLPDADERPESAALVLELLTHPERVRAAARPAPAPLFPPWYRDRTVLYAVVCIILAIEGLVLAAFRAKGGA